MSEHENSAEGSPQWDGLVDPSNPKRSKAPSDVESDESLAQEAVKAYESAAQKAHDLGPEYYDTRKLFDLAYRASKIPGLVNTNNPDHNQAYFALEAHKWASWIRDDLLLFDAAHQASKIDGLVDPNNPERDQAAFALEAYYLAVKLDDKNRLFAATHQISEIHGFVEVTHRASKIPGLEKQVRNLITSGYDTERLFDFVLAVAGHESPYQDRYVALAGDLAGDDPAKRSQIPEMGKKQSRKL